MRPLLRGRQELLDKNHDEWGRARIVCASLGWLPLALHLAGAYLGYYPDVKLDDYFERLGGRADFRWWTTRSSK